MKTHTVRIAVAQINPTVGALDENAQIIRQYVRRIRGFGADIIVFPELALTGYPPEDLLHKPAFIRDTQAAMKKLSRSVDKKIVVIAGFVRSEGRHLYNSAAVIYNGRVRGAYDKMFLPNYGVFDERRYFAPGAEPVVFRYGPHLFGLAVCEDMWHKDGPISREARAGAQAIIVINASPYHMGKINERESAARSRAKERRVALIYANITGGQDELVFDGQSMIVDRAGVVSGRAEAFKEDILIGDLELPVARVRRGARVFTAADKIPVMSRAPLPRRDTRPLEPVAEVYRALVTGVRDYTAKNGFHKVVIGLSGGIDSAIVAAIAVDALGKGNVIGIFMPSRYSSRESAEDARGLAENLGIKFITVSIEQIYKIYLMTLEQYFAGSERNIAEENLQARIRGTTMMAFSNKFGWLVLTTGNKSEMSTGYATLYGDMAGGFAVIKDVPKMLVYDLSRYRNSLGLVIPDRILIKEPTAELKPDQKDSDTLPPYETLDGILKAYVEEDMDLAAICAKGFDRTLVERVIQMVDKSEYKRRQAAPGIKITPKAFGRDRRMPITNKYTRSEKGKA